jgi:AcrR family transcriptional regulator
MSSTRQRLLEAAEAILKREGIGGLTMKGVGREAGVSRQAVYLHFKERADLLVALVEQLERDDEQAYLRVRGARSGELAVREWAEAQASKGPRIAEMARALDALRREDSAAAAAWRRRATGRLILASRMVERLSKERAIHGSWSPAVAAILLAEVTSFRFWDDLVGEAGLSHAAYVEIVVATVFATLAAPRAERSLLRSARA